jgi:hypothetical protein
MLVQQSASAQLDKLDQLTLRLEMLNSGIAVAGARPQGCCATLACAEGGLWEFERR